MIRSDGWAGVERHVAALAAEQDAAGTTCTSSAATDPGPAAPRPDVAFQPADTVLQALRALHAGRFPR